MFIVNVHVTLRPAILDVQGKAVEHALHNLGHAAIAHVRMGKFITFRIDADDEKQARRTAEEACANLLANPIIEDYTIALERATQPAEAAARG